MFATLISAILVCAGSLMLGQAILRVCGTRGWSWLAGPVGLSGLMLVTVPALHVPGRSATVAVLAALLVLGAVAWAVREPGMRPPVGGLLAIVPVGLLVAVPFLTVGYDGTLGVSLNNDMASHLAWAEGYRSADVARVLILDPNYPLGPHALAAALAQGLGIAVDHAFAGLTAAVPVLLGLTGLLALRPGARWPAQVVVASLVGLPFLVASYYGQGSFKEIMQTLFVLAFVFGLRRLGEASGPLRWLPLGVLVCGTLSVYSFAGLAWPIAIAAVWLAGLAVSALLEGRLRPRAVVRAIRVEAAPLLLAGGLTLVALVPQLPRLVEFFLNNAGDNVTGIEKGQTAGGNLVGRLPIWEAFGVWDNPEYRLPALHPFTAGMWAAFVLALVIAGGIWCLRRRDWLLPAAAATCIAIWVVADHTQSSYFAAKALVILSPLLVLLAVRPLVEPLARTPEMPRLWAFAPFLLAAVLAAKCVDDSFDSLRVSPVGPRDHMLELRELRPLLAQQRTLFLGNDDFIRWELAGVPVNAPVVGIAQLPIRPEKAWEYGQPFDLDTVDADVLNDFQWVITTRDAAGSAPPPQLRQVRRTRSFTLWRRTGTVQSRAVLREGEAPAAKLNCQTARGRAIARLGGEAGIREQWVAVEVPPVEVGGTVVVRLRLTPGAWDLGTPYYSSVPLEVSYGGLRTTLPAHADRPGPRWPIGRIAIDRPTKLAVRLYPRKPRFGRANVVTPTSIIATPVSGNRVVPLRDACDKLVDWYRPRGE
jgi:hypothetical protein